MDMSPLRYIVIYIESYLLIACHIVNIMLAETYTTEIDEMTLIPYQDDFPTSTHHSLFVSGRRPSRCLGMREANSIYAILSLGEDN